MKLTEEEMKWMQEHLVECPKCSHPHTDGETWCKECGTRMVDLWMAMICPKDGDLIVYGNTRVGTVDALYQVVWDWRMLEGDTNADIGDIVDSIIDDSSVWKRMD